MRLVADYHTHTVHSHGKGSVDDNVREALRRGLKAVGISDHSMAHALYGVRRVDEYLADISRAKEKYAGRIEVRTGIELNIIGLDGSVDLPQGVFDTVIMGYHKSAWCRDLRTMWVFSTPGFSGRADEITRAYIQAMRRHRIDIIAHPGYGVPVDVKTLAKACADYGVLWEINNKHAELGPEDLALAASVGARFVIASDAHSPENVGCVPAAFSLARRAGLGAAQIANVTEE
ncbi:MAG: PHP domain-containing protein [Christensenellaceae bacterium]|nr:PHP domain-containing protein [Christensenellaceae bacterium]